jgi:hypothetical protein
MQVIQGKAFNICKFSIYALHTSLYSSLCRKMQARSRKMVKIQKKVAIGETVANSEITPESYAISEVISEVRSQTLKKVAISDMHANGEIN